MKGQISGPVGGVIIAIVVIVVGIIAWRIFAPHTVNQMTQEERQQYAQQMKEGNPDAQRIAAEMKKHNMSGMGGMVGGVGAGGAPRR